MEALPTDRFARYELEGVLGHGGMAVVYAARERTHGASVALKCLSIERFGVGNQRDRAVSLFEREYHALSQLAHPHIIQVYDYGLDPQGPYYTMERLAGESLRARAPLSWVEACGMARDIASALSLLHSRSMVHRDVTPLNIYCLPDGRVKLIDFGAMMPVGVARHIVGTPAFTAPESLHQQSLDGRTDLFALGGCLYYAITGQHAYPARTLEMLHDVWRTPPAPPSRFADIPEALDELVLSLLRLERDDRPRTAAEVYERLTTLAGPSRDDTAATVQAYLTRPRLVGRDAHIQVLRERAQATLADTGCALLVRGARGVGRSGLLDAAVLEATLCGLQVARADAVGARANSLGAARQLVSALLESNAVSADTLEALELTAWLREGLPAGLDGERRGRMLEALTRALFDACRRQPLALVVDDAHAIDEPSLALLAGLSAHVHEHRLMIVCSMDRDVTIEPGSAGALLARCSQRIDLHPLDEEQSRALWASLFDDVLNIDLLVAVTHRHCKGNPRMLLDAAQRLIEQGLVKYESGSWLINSSPEALSAAIEDRRDLEQRLNSLSADAVELLEVISFDRHSIVNLASYPMLLAHADSARMHRALSELVETRWLELHEDCVHLMHEDHRDALAARIAPNRRQWLHANAAERCVELALPPVYEARHWLGAGEEARAVAALDRFTEFVDAHPTAEVLRHPVTLETTEAISLLRGVPGAHPALRAKYLAAAALNGTYRTLAEFTAARMPTALAALGTFSGVEDYARLSQLPAAERLSAALNAAAGRGSETGLGAMGIASALRRHTQLSVATGVIANFMSDTQLLEALPDLTPFRVLSPALDVAAQTLEALTKLVRGQVWLGWDTLLDARRRLSGPAAEQIDPLTRMVLNRVVLGYLCELSADHVTGDAMALIDEYAVQMPDLAASDRTRYWIARGDLAAAAEARRSFAELSVRTGSLASARIIELPCHLTFYALCGDIIGLRRTHRALQEVARTRPGWQPRVELAHAYVLRCRGSLHEALSVIEPLTARLVAPHTDWQLTAATHIELLTALKRSAEAVARGHDYLDKARAAALPTYHIAWALAEACLAYEQTDQAETHVGRAIAELEQRGANGVLIGCAYEVAARVALTRGEVALFEERAEACAKHLRPGKHPGLTARCNELQRARTRRDRGEDAPGWLQTNSVLVWSETRMAALQQLASSRIDDATFYRGALDLMLGGTAAIGGVLYLQEAGVLRRVAMAGALAARPDLDPIVIRHCTPVDASDTASVTHTQSANEADDLGALGVYVFDSGADAKRIEGAVALEFATADRPPPSSAWLAGVGAVMAKRVAARSALGIESQSRTASTQTPGSLLNETDTVHATTPKES